MLFDSPRLGGSPGVWDPKSVRRGWCGLQHSSPRWSCKRGSAGGAAGRCEGEGSRTFGEGSRMLARMGRGLATMPTMPMPTDAAVDAQSMPMRCATMPHNRRSVGRSYYGRGPTMAHDGRSSALAMGSARGRIGQSTVAMVPPYCLSTVPLLSTGAVRCQTARLGAHCVPPRSLACTATTERPSALPDGGFPTSPRLQSARLGSARLLPGSASLGLQLTQPSPFARYVKPPR